MAVQSKPRKRARRRRRTRLRFRENVQSMVDKLWKEVSDGWRRSGTSAKSGSAKLAVSMVKLQKSAFDQRPSNGREGSEAGRETHEEYVEEASWMPTEGKD